MCRYPLVTHTNPTRLASDHGGVRLDMNREERRLPPPPRPPPAPAPASTPTPNPSVSEKVVVNVIEARKEDRKSTRLNSSHLVITYSVFCYKHKKRILTPNTS